MRKWLCLLPPPPLHLGPVMARSGARVTPCRVTTPSLMSVAHHWSVVLVRMAGLLLGCCMEIWLVAAAGWLGWAGRSLPGGGGPLVGPAASTSHQHQPALLFCGGGPGQQQPAPPSPAALITSS